MTIIGLQIQNLKVKVKCGARIFTVRDPVISQYLLKYKLYDIVTISKNFVVDW
jgi:hypothetical protein